MDNALGCIVKVTSVSGPKLPVGTARTVYSRLCRLMGSLLSSYRKKLGGRYHLVLPVMQGLLRCLFTSDKSFTQARPISDAPTWLTGGGESIGPTQGSQYARLLTTICDPTVSSVARARNKPRRELNDETKKARSIAGQYMHYLIMEYANLQLHGRITPEVKAAIMPGLYSALDVVSMESMRAMNAQMDAQSRAIFKGLYDDYRKFGKWDKR